MRSIAVMPERSPMRQVGISFVSAHSATQVHTSPTSSGADFARWTFFSFA